MELACPKCNTPLPEVETIKYRFCPHCGAEIAAEPQHLDDVYLTIPPEPQPPQADLPPTDLSPQTEEKITVAGPIDDRTREPQPTAGRSQLRLRPPDTPPPASFYRDRSDEKTHSIRSEEKMPPKRNKKTPSPTKKRNIIIVVLVILAMIILLLGGLFTF